MNVRVATDGDLAGITETLTAAFAADPLWSWAFPEREALAEWWRFLIRSALRYPWVWLVDEYAAASVWIPPGGRELTTAEEDSVDGLLSGLCGPRAPEVLELLERFERSHPAGRPHYYLSLLGTHPEHRGKGVGMSLLADNLRRIDGEGLPAYLESSNPANDSRYERHGFKRVGEFSRPDGGLEVATMWREPDRTAS
jgi:GNAT superfamily N-acetyltransferase